MWSGRVSFAIPIAAVLAFAAMLGWFGWNRLKPGAAPDAPSQMVARAPSGKPAEPGTAPSTAPATPVAPQPAVQAAIPDSRSATEPGAPTPRAGIQAPSTGAGNAPAASGPAPTAPGTSPSFDIVRVEPSGDSVIAGRAAPRGRVRLLDNGREIAALAADESGQFVIVPPPLAAGSHELVLQVDGQDSAAAASPQSVTVVVAEAKNQPPLVTLTVPGRPSVILSRPDAPPPSAAIASRTDGARPAERGAVTSPGVAGAVPGRPGPAPAPSATPRIVSVESEGAGRLYVSGTVAPSASVRLYLNDAFVAAAAAGTDGRLAFAIESGIRPGDYRVRLDVVDAATGAVLSRAEAPFAMPASAAVAGGPTIPLPPPAPGRPVVVAAAPASPATSTTDQAPSAPLGVSGASGPGTPAAAPSAAGAAQPTATGVSGNPIVPSVTTPSAASAASPTGLSPATRQPPALSASPPAAQPGGSARVAETGAPAAGVTVVPEVNTAIVSRGESLWQISKRTYGSGLRYTVIFGANTPQIRDPDLIYPGQVFVLPTGQPVTVTR